MVVARRIFAFPAEGGWWAVPLIPAVIIALTTATIALIAPPNNWDSMTYHMSRVEHWRANASVTHYPTSVVWQLYLNPWAEFAILQFQTLGFGSDRLANSVQWFAFVGSMAGVSLLVRSLGGPFLAQSLAALVVASTPMVILQSSSTQNDLVCGFFVVAAVYFLLERQAASSRAHELYASLAVALAIATKGTAYPILLTFLAYALFFICRQEGLIRAGRFAWILFLGVLLMNGSHWARNFGLWRHPLGDPGWLARYQNESFGVRETVSNVVRNVALHLSTPSSRVNAFIEAGVEKIHSVLGISVSEPSLTFERWSQILPDAGYLIHEDYASNGIVFLLSVLSVGCAVVTRAGRRIRTFALLLCSSSLLFCILLKWAPWNSRLHTPLFLLAAVLVGWLLAPRQVEISNMNREWWQRVAVPTGIGLIAGGVALNVWVIAWLFAPSGAIHSQPLKVGICVADIALIGCGVLMIFRPRWYLRAIAVFVVLMLTLGALPYVALNQLRPLISTQYAPSIFVRTRIEQMFANNSGLIKPYTELVSVLLKRPRCRGIGLNIRAGAFEYPLWQIARQAGEDLVFFHVEVENESAKIKNDRPGETPCAVVVIGREESWDPTLLGLKEMDTGWSRSGVHLLVPMSER